MVYFLYGLSLWLLFLTFCTHTNTKGWLGVFNVLVFKMTPMVSSIIVLGYTLHLQGIIKLHGI